VATKNVADITDSASGARGEDNFGRDSARRDSARRRSLRTNTQRGSVERPREPELETGEGHVNPTLRVVLQQLTNVLRPTELCRLLTSLRSVRAPTWCRLRPSSLDAECCAGIIYRRYHLSGWLPDRSVRDAARRQRSERQYRDQPFGQPRRILPLESAPG
jgi:hypothetical protein